MPQRWGTQHSKYGKVIPLINEGIIFTPRTIALIYAVAGIAWILLSDIVVLWVVDEQTNILIVEISKGLLYVGITTALVYGLASRAQQQVHKKLAEEELQRTQNLLNVILSSLGEAVLLINPSNKTILQYNSAAERLFGYNQEELLGKSTEILHESSQSYEEFGEISESILSTDGIFHGEIRMKKKNSTFIEVEVTVTAINEELGWQGGVISIVHDITERKRAEQKLLESRRLYRDLIERTPDLITRVDRDGRLLFVNHASINFFGIPEKDCIGRLAFDFIHSDDREATISAFEDWLKNEEEIFFYENRLVGIDGQEHLVTWSIRAEYDEAGQIYGFASTARDISEKRQAEKDRTQLENQLQQAQKMELIGHLAGGIAHDFNNMLGVILGHAELALKKSDQAKPVNTNLQEIRRAANRSADLTRQLLTFARKQTIQPKVRDLNDLVSGMLKMLQRLIGENIHIAVHPAPSLWPVKIDTTQFDQILTNLCVNARDAISGAGTITIRTKNINLDEVGRGTHSEIVPGDYVLLTVSDDGSGMSQETLAHIFDPFFTTKDIGIGTGLGLATAMGAVKQHGGYIYAISELGQGTSFNIYLPRAKGTIQKDSEPIDKPTQYGTETILLVEDDSMLLQLLTSILEESGYKVLSAATTDLAQSLAKEHLGLIDLLITDLILPGIDGKELSENLLLHCPEMKVLFMSGYSENIISNHGVIHEGIHLLQKPIPLDNLINTVRDILDSPKQ